MKYLKLVKAEAELIDPKMDKPSVYFYKDGDMIRIFKGSSAPEPTYEMVDLGLSVKWATCNLGASSPEEYGNFYAWGETQWYDDSFTEKKFSEDDYTASDYNDDVLDTEHDAVAVLGGNYRMPTKAECDELYTKCTRKVETVSSVSGMRFTASNGNSIFIPFAGVCDDGSRDDAGTYFYMWSSSRENEDNAWRFYGCQDGDTNTYDECRWYGYSVRPVCE